MWSLCGHPCLPAGGRQKPDRFGCIGRDGPGNGSILKGLYLSPVMPGKAAKLETKCLRKNLEIVQKEKGELPSGSPPKMPMINYHHAIYKKFGYG
jgi:hypothetical protein